MTGTQAGLSSSDILCATQLGKRIEDSVLSAAGFFALSCDGSGKGPRSGATHMHNEIPTLVIIDMQQGMAMPSAGSRNNPNAERNIAALLAAWRKADATLVHVRHISRTVGSPFWPGQPGVEFQELLAPLPSEHVVEKNVPDALISTGLERWLRVRSITKLVIVGVSTNNSVEATARTAGNLGFETRVVSDATFAFEKVDYSGIKRTAEEVHAMALANLDGEYATIISTEHMLHVF
jgi:nicotinamidase-related amidase